MSQQSYWDLFPEEIKDLIFYFTNIETVLLNERFYVLNCMKKQKKYGRLFNWTSAVKYGNILLLNYLLENKCTTNHSNRLIEKALVCGNISAADYIWNHRTEIIHLLWKSKRARWYNRHVSFDSMEIIIERSSEPVKAVEWLLTRTNEYFTCYAVDKVIQNPSCKNEQILKKLLTYRHRLDPQYGEYFSRCYNL
jgi:hypothetical protein